MTMVLVNIEAQHMLWLLSWVGSLPGPALQLSEWCQLNTNEVSHAVWATILPHSNAATSLQVQDSMLRALMLGHWQQQPEPWTPVASQSLLQAGTPQTLMQLQRGRTGRSNGLLHLEAVLRPAGMERAISRRSIGIDQRCAKLTHANKSCFS